MAIPGALIHRHRRLGEFLCLPVGVQVHLGWLTRENWGANPEGKREQKTFGSSYPWGKPCGSRWRPAPSTVGYKPLGHEMQKQRSAHQGARCVLHVAGSACYPPAAEAGPATEGDNGG